MTQETGCQARQAVGVDSPCQLSKTGRRSFVSHNCYRMEKSLDKGLAHGCMSGVATCDLNPAEPGRHGGSRSPVMSTREPARERKYECEFVG